MQLLRIASQADKLALAQPDIAKMSLKKLSPGTGKFLLHQYLRRVAATNQIFSTNPNLLALLLPKWKKVILDGRADLAEKQHLNCPNEGGLSESSVVSELFNRSRSCSLKRPFFRPICKPEYWRTNLSKTTSSSGAALGDTNFVCVLSVVKSPWTTSARALCRGFTRGLPVAKREGNGSL
jgi:hypothetical protein